MLRFQLGDALLGSLLFGFQLAVAVGLGARELLRALFDLRAQLGDRLLRGGQTLFERVLRTGRGRIGLGELITLALGGGEFVTQLCILAAEAIALLLERFDLLLALERGFFDITDDVIAVEAAEDGTLEGIFHVSPTFSFVKVMVTQTRRDDKEKSATS